MFWFSHNTLNIIAFILSSFLPFMTIYDYPNICPVPLLSIISVLLPWSYQANCSPYMISSYLFDWLLLIFLTSSPFLSPGPLYVVCSLQHAFLYMLKQEQNLDGLSVLIRNFPNLECLSYADSWLKVIWFPCLINKWCCKHVKVMY